MEIQREIWFKKCGISNQPDVCIFDDPCLSKFGALRGACPHPGRQFVGLLCVSLAAPESPPIVSGVSDMHPSDCPNVEETRNPMQTFGRKKCSHFSPTNFPLHFHMKSVAVFLIIFNITYHKKDTTHFMRAPSAALRQPCLGQPQARKLHCRNAQNNTGTHIPDPQSIASVLEQLAGLECKGGKCCKAAADAGL